MEKAPVKKNIVFGLFAYRVDGGLGPERHTRWRPLLHLCGRSDMAIDTLYLFAQDNLEKHLTLLREDLNALAPKMYLTVLSDGHAAETFEDFYLIFYRYFKQFRFDFEHTDYYLYFPPGIFPHVSLAIMDVVRTLWLPFRIIQVYQYGKNEQEKSKLSIFSLNVQEALRQNMEEDQQRLADQDYLKGGVITRNTAYNRLIARLEHIILHSRAPVLLSGESGVGKSRLVRRLYEVKRRHGQLAGPLVEVNCSALQGDMAMATLFGHTKNAFTGAGARRDGLLLHADGGMLFLDEIGELRLNEQSMLLKAVEEKKFLPLGADTAVETEFQLICATNRDLLADVADGRFRADLLERLNMWHILLPPLRERREDIAPNVLFECERLSRQMNLHVRFAPDAEEAFLRFAVSEEAVWPGNFRELASTLERMATFGMKGRIETDVVDEEIRGLRRKWRDLRGKAAAEDILAHVLPEGHEQLDLFEQFHLRGVVEVCRASATPAEAGRRLYGVSRLRKRRRDDGNRLYRYLQSYGLRWEDVRQ